MDIYDARVKLWGKAKLDQAKNVDSDWLTVNVAFESEQGSYDGCDTCGYGADEGYAYIEVSGRTVSGQYVNLEITDYTFPDLLREAFEVEVTSEHLEAV